MGEISTEISVIDIMLKQVTHNQYQFDSTDVCLIAVPSFGGRVPTVASERLKQLRGNGARAILVAVYGNRAYEDTLLELYHVLEQAGFECVAAVAAVAEHSIMHQFGRGRPNDEDSRKLIKFAQRINNALESDRGEYGVQVPGNVPYREFKGVPFVPKAGRKCNQCGLCAKECPVDAIQEDHPKGVNKKTCISCMHCIKVCPQGARTVNKMLLLMASRKMEKTCGSRKENELFITES